MNIIICLDDKNGILFNRRRQSSDKTLCERILSLTKDGVLWMNEYSAKLFESEKINVHNDFLRMAKMDEYCFVEGDEFLPYNDEVEKVIVYRWNRVYPSDTKIDAAFLSERQKVRSVDFVGNSHGKITEEIYE